jgi:hypothetical protein
MRRLFVLLCTLVLIATTASCSSGDDDRDAADDDAAESTDAADSDGGDGDDGGSGAGGGEDDDFCAQLEASVGDEEIDIETDEGMEAFQELVDAAPDALAEPMGVIEDAFAQVTGLDEDDPEAFAEAFDVLFDPEVMAAFEEVEAFGVETCGLPEGFLDTESDDESDDETADDAETGNGDFVSTDEVQAHLDATVGDVPPFSEIVGWSSVNGVFSVSFDAAPSVADATQVCEAVSGYIFDVGGYDPSIEVGVYGPSEEPIVLREGAESDCRAP